MPPLRLTSLKNICLERGAPYQELSFDDSHSALARRRIHGIDAWHLRTPYIYCGLAHDVAVFANTCLYTTAGEYVFHAQSFQSSPKLGSFKELATALIEARRESVFESFIEEECIYFGGMWGGPHESDPSRLKVYKNFGHFIFEFLNRMADFEMLGLSQRLPLVICEDLPETWIDFIELAGGSRDRLIRVPATRASAYRKVWVSSCCHYRDQDGVNRFWTAGLNWLRYKVWQSIGGPKLSQRRRLYIGRDGAPTRRIVNEPDVIALLARYGVEHVPISTLSARTQVEAVSGAEMIVFAIGASCVMAHFAPEHCVNIVLSPQTIGRGIWGGAGAAAVLRQPYERLECEAVESEAMRLNTAGQNELADFKVDLVALQDLVEAGLKIIETSQKRDALPA